MADSYHIIDGKVVPYYGGRKCNDTYAWRDATQLELQLQEQLEEYEHTIAALQAEVEALRSEVERLREERDALRADVAEWKASADDLAAALRNCLKLAYNCHRDELPSAIITTASKAVAKYDMLVDFSAALDD